MRWFSLVLALAGLFLTPGYAAGKEPAPADKKEEARKDFDVPMPVGIPVKGIKIPHRNEEGKLIMTIEAEVAKKLDDQNLEMENMKIESFDEEGKTINIEIPHSIFNLDSRILVGDSHALIRREDFEITGDSVEFNTQTRHATLRGKIRMIIQSTEFVK